MPRLVDERSQGKWRAQRYALLIWSVPVVLTVTVLELRERHGFMPIPGVLPCLGAALLLAVAAVTSAVTALLRTKAQVVTMHGAVVVLLVFASWWMNG